MGCNDYNDCCEVKDMAICIVQDCMEEAKFMMFLKIPVTYTSINGEDKRGHCYMGHGQVCKEHSDESTFPIHSGHVTSCLVMMVLAGFFPDSYFTLEAHDIGWMPPRTVVVDPDIGQTIRRLKDKIVKADYN
jgi:hypothetical protein